MVKKIKNKLAERKPLLLIFLGIIFSLTFLIAGSSPEEYEVRADLEGDSNMSASMLVKYDFDPDFGSKTYNEVTLIISDIEGSENSSNETLEISFDRVKQDKAYSKDIPLDLDLTNEPNCSYNVKESSRSSFRAEISHNCAHQSFVFSQQASLENLGPFSSKALFKFGNSIDEVVFDDGRFYSCDGISCTSGYSGSYSAKSKYSEDVLSDQKRIRLVNAEFYQDLPDKFGFNKFSVDYEFELIGYAQEMLLIIVSVFIGLGIERRIFGSGPDGI